MKKLTAILKHERAFWKQSAIIFRKHGEGIKDARCFEQEACKHPKRQKRVRRKVHGEV